MQRLTSVADKEIITPKDGGKICSQQFQKTYSTYSRKRFCHTIRYECLSQSISLENRHSRSLVYSFRKLIVARIRGKNVSTNKIPNFPLKDYCEHHITIFFFFFTKEEEEGGLVQFLKIQKKKNLMMQSEILDTKYKNIIGAYHQKLIVVHIVFLFLVTKSK